MDFQELKLSLSEMETRLQDIKDNIHPLGAPKAQIHKSYVLSETKNGICIVDQHAAHERLVMEEMKKQ